MGCLFTFILFFTKFFILVGTFLVPTKKRVREIQLVLALGIEGHITDS